MSVDERIQETLQRIKEREGKMREAKKEKTRRERRVCFCCFSHIWLT